MDIVTRLKDFINFVGLPVTQFADVCNIPRPTLSQLLNGRNKKVSDELISKIHDAYPNLSVLWLMFGEGDMLHDKNIALSEAQNAPIYGQVGTQKIDNETISQSIDFEKNYNEPYSENFAPHKTPEITFEQVASAPSTGYDSHEKQNLKSPSTITFNTEGEKRIVNIIVYYNDNSFESFVPNNK